MFEALSTLALQHRRATFAAWLAFAVLCAVALTHLTSGSDPSLFLPDYTPQAAGFEAACAVIGSGRVLAIGYEADDVLAPDSLRAVAALTSSLRRQTSVSDVTSLTTVIPAASLAAAAPALRDRIASQPDLQGSLLSADRRAGAVFVTLAQDAHGPTVMREAVQAARDAGLRGVQIGGPVAFEDALDRAMRTDLLRVAPLMILALAGLLLAVFRSVRAVLGSLLVMGAGLAAAFVPQSALGVPVTLTGLIAIPLIAAEGLGCAVHWLWASQRRGLSPADCARAVGSPTLWSAATTALAMGSLSFSSFPALRWLGASAALGVMAAWLASATLLPALIAWTARPALRTAALIPAGTPRWRFALWIAAGLVAAAAAAGLSSLHVESNLAFALPADSELRQAEAWFEQRLSGLVTVEVIVRAPHAADSPEARATLEALRAAGHTVANRPSGDSSLFHATVRLSERPSAELAAAEREIERIAAAQWPAGSTITVTGLVPLLLGSMSAMLRGLAWNLLSALALIAVAFGIALGSLRGLLVALVPTTLPVLATLGLMAWIGRPVDFVTAAVGCAVLGIAADDTVHLLIHHRRRAARGEPLWRAHSAILAEVGPALVLTTAISTLSFAALAVCSLLPLRGFGLWTALALGLALAADLWLLPSLLPTLGSKEAAHADSHALLA